MVRMPTIDNRGPFRRFVTSKGFIMLIFIVLVVVAMYLGTQGVSGRVQSNQTDFLADAVRRSAVQCYTLEGRFPESIYHLEDNYGLVIDRNRFAVYYEFMGSNIIPQIRVVGISR